MHAGMHAARRQPHQDFTPPSLNNNNKKTMATLDNLNLIRRGNTLKILYQSQTDGADASKANEWRLCTIETEPGIHPRYQKGISFGVMQDGARKQFYLSGVLEIRPPPPPSTTGEPSDDDSYSDSGSNRWGPNDGGFEEEEPRLNARKRRRLVRAIATAIEEALA
jgi:hypothetical protein